MRKMKVIRDITEMQKSCLSLKRKGRTIGFVPTMGSLHKGHVSLIQRARRYNDFVVVSIFVNPIQFLPGEDFRKYPRNLALDAALCKKEKVDIIFYPESHKLYPKDFRTYVEVTGLGDVLCGEFRPGHFRGVTTVVNKLFNIVQPDRAYFGQKDIQQLTIIKRMVEDLNIPIDVIAMPTVRDSDGLASSSRNIYLSSSERQDALAVPNSFKIAQSLIKDGLRDARKIKNLISKLIRQKMTIKIDYIEIVDPLSLEPVRKVANGSVLALAARVGKTRLIDNLVVRL